MLYKKILKQGSKEAMMYIGNFKKYSYIFVISFAKLTTTVVIAFLALLYGDFCIISYSVDSDEARR
jgi:hypothetical protein